MVPLPLFKLAALFVRHISKYGANYIKRQAKEHPKFRTIAERNGQHIHQFNMRMSVATLRNEQALNDAHAKAEAPTVKTKEQTEKEDNMLKKYGVLPTSSHNLRKVALSPWRRHFRPLPEAKAVDLFADVAGDSFVLLVAGGLVIYEYWRSLSKPDKNLERIMALNEKVEELQGRVEERELQLEEQSFDYQHRLEQIENILSAVRDPRTMKPLLIPTIGNEQRQPKLLEATKPGKSTHNQEPGTAK